jgi:hypothetical protein
MEQSSAVGQLLNGEAGYSAVEELGHQQPVQEPFTAGLTPFMAVDGQDIVLPSPADAFNNTSYLPDSTWSFNGEIAPARDDLLDQVSPSSAVADAFVVPTTVVSLSEETYGLILTFEQACTLARLL